jgi:hypothetical protein
MEKVEKAVNMTMLRNVLVISFMIFSLVSKWFPAADF